MATYLKKNFHTHTTRCKHAVGEDRAYVESAIAAGIEVLGFSDHIPMPTTDARMNSIRMLFSEVDDYMDSILGLRDEYKRDIQILVGFEGEYFKTIFEEQMKLLAQYPYDYLILGQHFMQPDGRGVYTGSGTDSVSVLKSYVDTCIEGLATGAYAYLCHPDLMNFSGDERIWRQEMTRLCDFCKENGYPLEYNLLGLAEGRHYPSHRFFSLAGEVGNDIILGIDAHAPQQIGEQDVYQEALKMIKKYHLQIVDTI